MARPEMERRAGDRNPGAPNSCRMEVLRQDAWASGSIIQPCHRHRTIATQTSTGLPPLTHVPTQDAFSSDSVQQQDNPLRDNTGTEQELSSLRERPLPLSDLLPDSQSSSEDSTSSSSTSEDDLRLEEQAVERVAIQLRTIGDEMNAVFLQRNAAPHWQNWRGLYRGLVACVADTINALYQHGLR